MFLFMIEKPYFSFQSTTISDEFSTLADHSVTGDEYGKVIGMIGSADGTYCLRTAYHRRFFEIVSSFSVGYLFECLPHLHLELGSMWSKRNGELFPLSSEVFRKLFFCLIEDFIGSVIAKYEAIHALYLWNLDCFVPRNDRIQSLLERREPLREFTVISEFEEMESVFICESDEVTESGWDDGSRE